jgi:hypothetical protein
MESLLSLAAFAAVGLMGSVSISTEVKILQANASQDPGKAKLAKIEKLENSASSGIIHLDDKNYE